MQTMYERLQSKRLNEGEVAVCFLGQAGVLFKYYPDHYVILDPYFTNFCEEKIGLKFKRLIPQLLDPADLDALKLKAYLMTHHHEDHLDAVGIPALQDLSFPFYAPPDSIKTLEELGIDPGRCSSLFDGAAYESGSAKIYGVFADHGKIAPDAVGIVFEVHGKVVFHMGDTCLNRDELQKIAEQFQIDLLFAPINGRYGNMDETDAAEAVAILKPHYVVPCHFWMLPGNSGGDPEAFIDKVADLAQGTETLLFTPGEIFMLS